MTKSVSIFVTACDKNLFFDAKNQHFKTMNFHYEIVIILPAIIKYYPKVTIRKTIIRINILILIPRKFVNGII